MKEQVATVNEHLSQMKTQMQEDNTKLSTQIKHVRDFVDSGKMELEKLITESIREIELRTNKHNQYTNEKLG